MLPGSPIRGEVDEGVADRLGHPVPKVHDLAELLALLPADAARRLDTADLQTLNPWSILGRYPDDVSEATDEEALAWVAAAQRVLEAVVIDADYP